MNRSTWVKVEAISRRYAPRGKVVKLKPQATCGIRTFCNRADCAHRNVSRASCEITRAACSRRAVRIDSQHARHGASAGRLIVRFSQFRGSTPKNSQRALSKRGANHLHEGLLMRVVQTINGWPVLDWRTPASGSTFVSLIRCGTRTTSNRDRIQDRRRDGGIGAAAVVETTPAWGAGTEHTR